MLQMKDVPAEEDEVRRGGNGDDRGREGSLVMRLMTEARSNAGMGAPLGIVNRVALFSFFVASSIS